VSWADDIVIVDSYSTDATTDLAREARDGVRIFQHPFRDFGTQRNWALDYTDPRHDWVLFLDADERCTDELASAIRGAVRSAGPTAGYYLASRNYFLGRWIKRCTMYPSWQLRLLRRGEVRFCSEGHGQREVTDGPLGYIAAPYEHYVFSHGVEQWIRRHNEYSTKEVDLITRLRAEPLRLAELWGDAVRRRRCLKRLAARIGLRPLTRFVYLYLFRRGFLDGHPGLVYCLLQASYEIQIEAKLAERPASV
jgi:glycosyltransferase involved in cell wall biosynthesis